MIHWVEEKTRLVIGEYIDYGKTDVPERAESLSITDYETIIPVPVRTEKKPFENGVKFDGICHSKHFIGMRRMQY